MDKLTSWPLAWHTRTNTCVGFLPKIFSLNLIMKKPSNTAKFEDKTTGLNSSQIQCHKRWNEKYPRPGDMRIIMRTNMRTISAGKESSCNIGDPSSIPGWGRAPREGIGYPLQYYWASLVSQMVKNLPAMLETVQSLGWEDPLEKGTATHSSILWESPHGQRSPEGYSPWGDKESDTTVTKHSTARYFSWVRCTILDIGKS